MYKECTQYPLGMNQHKKTHENVQNVQEISSVLVTQFKMLHCYTEEHSLIHKRTHFQSKDHPVSCVCVFIQCTLLVIKEPANLIQDKMQSMHLKLS